MDERRLDDFFKDHLDNFQDEGSPEGGWDKMHGVLTQHAHTPQGGVFIQKWVLWSVAALLLLLIGSFFYSIRNQSQQIEMLHSSVATLTEELDGRGRAISRVDTLILLAGPDGKLHSVSPRKLEALGDSYAGSPDDFFSSAGTGNKTENRTSKQTYISTYQPSNHSPISKNTSTSENLANPIQSSPIGSTQEDSTQYISAHTKPDTLLRPDKGEAILAEDTKALDSTQQVQELIAETPKEKGEKPIIKPDPFLKKLAKQLGIRSGVGAFVGGGGNEYGETSPVIGGNLGIELSIGDRFAIRSGVRVSSLNYELGDLGNQLLSEDFLSRYPGIGSVDPAANLHELKMNGSFVGIPIGLRYYHPVNRKVRAFSGLDISGGSYLSQNFTYEFIQDGGEFYNRAKSAENPWTWGTGRISLGAEYGLKSNWQLETALFFEKDLRGRGVEGYEFYLVGLSTSLWLSH